MNIIIEYILLIAAIAIAILFVVLTWQRFKDWFAYVKSPEKTVHAKIIDKSTESTYTSLPGRMEGSCPAWTLSYLVTFQTDDGEELEFSVLEKDISKEEA